MGVIRGPDACQRYCDDGRKNLQAACAHHRETRRATLRHGYAIVPDFLTPRRAARRAGEHAPLLPDRRGAGATPERYGFDLRGPRASQVEFPFAGDALNDVSTHPEIDRVRRTAARHARRDALAGRDLGEVRRHRRLRAGAAPRLPGQHARRPARRRRVSPGQHDPLLRRRRPRTSARRTSSRRRRRTFRCGPRTARARRTPSSTRTNARSSRQAGDLLIFSMRTWHRASDIPRPTAPFSHHLVWRRRGHIPGLSPLVAHGREPGLQRFIERATPRQREVLGFPPRRIWNERRSRRWDCVIRRSFIARRPMSEAKGKRS